MVAAEPRRAPLQVGRCPSSDNAASPSTLAVRDLHRTELARVASVSIPIPAALNELASGRSGEVLYRLRSVFSAIA